MTRRRWWVLGFLAWLEIGLTWPIAGGVVFSAVVGVAGLRFLLRGYRRAYRWFNA